MASVIQDDAGIAGYYDPEKNETGDHYKLSESTPTYIRHDFIKKVFAIVFLQLLFSFGFMLLSYYVTPIRVFLLTYPFVGYIAMVVFIVSSLVISCTPDLVRNKTGAAIALSMMTPCLALLLATFCCRFQMVEIAIAAGVTTLVVACLIGFAFQTKYDFTSWITYVFVASIVFLVFGMIGLFIRSRVYALVMAGVGTLFCSFFILIDVQMIVGGNRKVAFTIDDYCLASMCLYTDIVTIFMDILRLVSAANQDN